MWQRWMLCEEWETILRDSNLGAEALEDGKIFHREPRGVREEACHLRPSWGEWALISAGRKDTMESSRFRWKGQDCLKARCRWASPQECNCPQNDSLCNRSKLCDVDQPLRLLFTHPSKGRRLWREPWTSSWIVINRRNCWSLEWAEVKVKFLICRKKYKLLAGENLIQKRASEAGGIRSYLGWVSRRDFFL